MLEHTPTALTVLVQFPVLGAAHILLVHTPLLQSAAMLQARPQVQRGQLLLPPQSTSVSTPSLMVLLQEAVGGGGSEWGDRGGRGRLGGDGEGMGRVAGIATGAKGLSVEPEGLGETLIWGEEGGGPGSGRGGGTEGGRMGGGGGGTARAGREEGLGGKAGLLQVPLVQLWDKQSKEEVQATPTLQAALQPPPPQSTPVSLPSLILLKQVAAGRHLPGNCCKVVLQLLERQSEGALQSFVVPHKEHVPPPQSTSVSAPSRTCR
jgi:hypothetical protein